MIGEEEGCSCANILARLKIIEEMAFSKKSRNGGTRAPSAYNIFIGKCMKEGKTMKACADEYKQTDEYKRSKK